jgi:hypothetical protein
MVSYAYMSYIFCVVNELMNKIMNVMYLVVIHNKYNKRFANIAIGLYKIILLSLLFILSGCDNASVPLSSTATDTETAAVTAVKFEQYQKDVGEYWDQIKENREKLDDYSEASALKLRNDLIDTGFDFGNNRIDGKVIDKGTITSAKIAKGAVTSDQIAEADAAAGTGITGTQLAAKADIKSSQLDADANILGSQLYGLTITGDKIANNTITSDKIAKAGYVSLSAGITTEHIAVAADIKGTQLEDLTITNAKIANNTITSNKIAEADADTGTGIKGTQLANDANIKGAQLEDLTIASAKIEDLTITSAKIANNTITSNKIAEADADTGTGITSMQLAANADIKGAQLKDLTITSNKIAKSTITPAHLDNELREKFGYEPQDADKHTRKWTYYDTDGKAVTEKYVYYNDEVASGNWMLTFRSKSNCSVVQSFNTLNTINETTELATLEDCQIYHPAKYYRNTSQVMIEIITDGTPAWAVYRLAQPLTISIEELYNLQQEQFTALFDMYGANQKIKRDLSSFTNHYGFSTVSTDNHQHYCNNVGHTWYTCGYSYSATTTNSAGKHNHTVDSSTKSLHAFDSSTSSIKDDDTMLHFYQNRYKNAQVSSYHITPKFSGTRIYSSDNFDDTFKDDDGKAFKYFTFNLSFGKAYSQNSAAFAFHSEVGNTTDHAVSSSGAGASNLSHFLWALHMGYPNTTDDTDAKKHYMFGDTGLTSQGAGGRGAYVSTGRTFNIYIK